MRIGIIGGGIGGLTAAVALQSDGHTVTVYERRADAGAVGTGLTLFGNAFAALDAIELGDLVREVSSTAVGRLRSGQRQPSGRWLVALPPSDAPGVRSLHRSDLHQALVTRLAPGTLRLGEAARVSEDGAPIVTVNRNEEQFDLVVAADGIRGEARARWGLDPGLRYAGYTASRGVTSSTGHLSDEAGETWGRGARFGIVPLPDDRVYWFATRNISPGGTDTDPAESLRRHFGSWHAPILELIDATPPQHILRHDIYDLASFPSTFVRGRGVLLGDAAHAMTPDLGQGAGQAIEDAATLVLLLRDAAVHDLDRILEEYDRLRRARTHGLWRQSRLTGRIAQAASPLAVRIRDAGLRAAPSRLMADAMTRLQQWEMPQVPASTSRRFWSRLDRRDWTDFVLERGTMPVSVRVRGHGPGVILIPGGMQTAADFDRLATYLAATFTTIVIDRRGRGSSSDIAPAEGIDAEAEDVVAVAKAMNAHHLFGLSSGALIALRAAQLDPNIVRALALYELPLATPGHQDEFDWTDDVAQLLESGDNTAALTRMIEVIGDHWAVRLAPHALLNLTARIALRWGRGAGREPLARLLPTFRQDARIVREGRDLLTHLSTVRTRTLLISGDRAAESLTAALTHLENKLPHARRVELDGVGHLSAANGGSPRRIASTLERFFTDS